ncbi:site-specific integrase [Schleiferilactobacillus perolens]|uniref:Bacteriophage integrase n=1 Tax=Schleiferilactobacillus perolens DSM 12744 TaxID=1423792 RepID=A0A0R1MYB0_9LACO|nr:site-specific integrase [Schleiferilactobacillus perolens]KRL13025.1 bacteriophage integrase [Schleiferilactobacillus perolens DSM 12744]
MASITKRGGSWQYRVSYKDKDGKRKYINLSGFPTKKAASIAAAEVERQYNRGADLSAHNVTLIEYWDRWLALYKTGKHARITEARYPTIRKHLLSYWGEERELKSISKSDWQEFINAFGKGRAKDTVSKLNGYVRSMVNSAIDDQIVYSNFTHGAILTGRKGKAQDLKYLQLSDMKRLYDYCADHASLRSLYNYIITTGLKTGARFAEIIGLQWDDVDLDNSLIHITKTWDYMYRTGFAPTKTPSSVRDVEIPTSLATLLRQLKKEQTADNLKKGYRDPLNLVFRNNRHEVPSNAAINKALHQVEEKLDINPRITFHGLRHTHVSYLISQGVDIYYISHRLGHSNIEITLRVYSHLLDQTRQEQAVKAIKALDAL